MFLFFINIKFVGIWLQFLVRVLLTNSYILTDKIFLIKIIMRLILFKVINEVLNRQKLKNIYMYSKTLSLMKEKRFGVYKNNNNICV